MKKLGIALSVAALFGLAACDSSSSASGNGISCNVTSDANSVTMSSSYMGQSYIEKYTISGETMITTITMKGMPQEEINEECEDTKDSYRWAEVTCSGNNIVITDDADGATLEQLKKHAETGCNAMLSNDYDEDDDY